MTSRPGWSSPAAPRRTSSTSGTGNSPRTNRSSAASTSAAWSPWSPPVAGWVDPDHLPLTGHLGKVGPTGPAAGQRRQ